MLLTNWLRDLKHRPFRFGRLKTSFGSLRRRRLRGHRDTQDAVRPAFEVLEDRMLLSNIDLTMSGFDAVFGTAPYLDIDNDGVRETTSEVAQNVVRASVRHWEQVIVDFNYDIGDTYDLEVEIDPSSPGLGAVTGVQLFEFFNGKPTEGKVTLQSGNGTTNGWGYFLDPTPDDWAEFPIIQTAFSGNVNPANVHPALLRADFNGNGNPDWLDPGNGSDSDSDGVITNSEGGLADFYTLVTHEIGHAMGMAPTFGVDYPNGLADDSGLADQDPIQPGPANGTLWLWRSEQVPRALLTSTNGTGANGADGPAHVAHPTASNTLTTGSGELFRGVDDLMNPFYPPNRRRMISDLDIRILEDSLDYTTGNAAESGTYYSSLNPVTRVLTLRGGTGTSGDAFAVRVVGGEVLVSVGIGNDIPGTLAWMTAGTSNAEASTYHSRFPVSGVSQIVINAGNGLNTLHYDELDNSSIPIRYNGGVNQDWVFIEHVTSNPNVDIIGSGGADFVEVRSAGLTAQIDFNGQGGDDRLHVGSDEATDPSFPRQEMLGTVRFFGGTEDDSIVVEHAEDFDLYRNGLEHTNGGRIEHTSVSDIEVNMFSGNQEIRVHGNRDDVALTINEFVQVNPSFPQDSGALNVTFAPGTRDLSPIEGDVTVEAVGLDGRIVLHDSGFGNERDYRIDIENRGPATNGFTTFAISAPGGPAANLAFQSYNDFTLNSTGGEAQITIDHLLPLANVTINAGNQDDELRLTPLEFVFETTPDGGRLVPVGADLTAIAGSNINFNAGGGRNRLSLDDSEAIESNSFRIGPSEVIIRRVVDPGGNVIILGDTVNFSGVDDISVMAGDLNDYFGIPKLLEPIDVELFGRGGNDRFEVGFSDGDHDISSNLEAHLVLAGGAEQDTLVIKDDDDLRFNSGYLIRDDSFSKSNGLTQHFPPIEYSDLDVLELRTSQLVENRVVVESFDGEIDIVAFGHDVIDVGHGLSRTLEGIHGVITIDGPSNAGLTLNVKDQNDTGSHTYTLDVGSVHKSQASGNVTIRYPLLQVDTLTLNAGAGVNLINVEGNAFVDTTINAGGEDDTIRITPAERNPGFLVSPVVINGQGGVDTLEIFDNADGDPANYTIDGSTISRENGWSSDIGQVEAVKLHATAGGNTFDIERTSAGIEYQMYGYGGVDTFNVGERDFDTRIHGPVILDGGSDIDHLVIDDRNDTGNDRYVFNNDGFTKVSAGLNVPLLSFSSMKDLTLEGSPGNNIFQIDATHSGTEYTLRGHDGDDEFRIDAAGLNFDVIVNGGDPSSLPGDSLHVTGATTVNGEPSSTGEYTPDTTQSDAGHVLIDGYDVDFAGLEPVFIENFASFKFVTPRSHDNINVTPEANGWSKISGTSGHPALKLSFESLSFRDVRNVFLNTALHDLDSFQYPPGPFSTTFSPFPDDIVNILPGALSARGLEGFRIITGEGENIVRDSTLISPPARPALLGVDGRGGHTQVDVLGHTAQSDFEQLVGPLSSLTLRNTEGREIYTVGLVAVDDLKMIDPQPLVRAIVENDELTIDESDTPGWQAIQGTLTTFLVSPESSSSMLEMVTLGRSRLNLGRTAFEIPSIQGFRPIDVGPQPEPPSDPNEIVINPFSVGPQPEPPRARVGINGFGPQDIIELKGMTINGTPQDMDFSIKFNTAEQADVELLNPFQPQIFDVAMPPGGNSPRIVLAGQAGTDNRGGFVRSPAVIEPPLRDPINWYFETRNLRRIDFEGNARDEMFMLSPQQDGGLAGAIMPLERSGEAPLEYFVTTDSMAGTLNFIGGDGLDEVELLYPDTEFRRVNADLQDVETFDLRQAGDRLTSLVTQTLTPTAGEIRTGNQFVTHDDAVSTSFVEGSTIDFLVTPDALGTSTFTRDISAGFRYTGSEGKFVFEKTTFEEKFDLTVENGGDTNSTTTIQKKDVVHKQIATTKFIGGDGNDQLLSSEAGVKYEQGSIEEIKLKKGDDIAVITKTNNSTAKGTQNIVKITGTGDPDSADSKTVLYHEQKNVTPLRQLDDLNLEKPELKPEIDFLLSKADPKLLEKTGTPQLDQYKMEISYEGTNTNADLFIKKVEAIAEPVIVKIENQGGTTDFAKEGNVVVIVPDLVGTDVDPTQGFTTFVVTNTFDSGPGSLRAAMEAANAWTGDEPTVITFDIPLADPGAVDLDGVLERTPIFENSTLNESFSPSLNADGTLVTFESITNPTGGNGDGSLEILLTDTTTGAITQLTSSLNPLGISYNSLISADGTRVAFLSNVDLLGDGTVRAWDDLFLFGTNTGRLTQVTHGSADDLSSRPFSPSINADGTRIAFLSDQDLDAIVGNPDRNLELFLFDTQTGETTQITETTNNTLVSAAINADGTRIAFSSNGAFDSSAVNTDGSTELFLFDSTTEQFTQITDTTNGSPLFLMNVAINAQGDRIAFSSIENHDPSVGNEDGNSEFFLYDSVNGITQVTDTTGFANDGGLDFSHSIDAEGRRIAFISRADFVGENPYPGIRKHVFVFDAATGRFTQLTQGEERPLGKPPIVRISTDGFSVVYTSYKQTSGFGALKHVSSTPDAFVISPQTALPALTRGNIVINGQTQQNATGDTNPLGPEIVLNGSSVNIAGLRLFSDNNTVHSLVIQSFGGNGVRISGDGNTITDNYIGTDATGNNDLGNGGIGVFVTNAAENRIENNVVSGNDVNGVVLGGTESTNNVVRGNHVGTNAEGTAAIGNFLGVHIANAPGNLIEDNLISGNVVGIDVSGVTATGNLIRNNRVGTTADGMAALGNSASGVNIDDSAGNLIGGAETGARNVISGNGGDGISISGNAPDTKTESFDLAHVTALHGWTDFGSRENRDSFGFSQTNHTDLPNSPGHEAGGTFARASSALGETVDPISYYADTQLGGTLTLDEPIHAEGELIVTAIDQFDGSVELGFFNRADAEAHMNRNMLSLRVLEPSSRQGTDGVRVVAEMVLANGTRVTGTSVNTPDGLELEVPYTWGVDYDPTRGTAGQGRLDVEIFADGISLGTSSIELSGAHRSIGSSLDAFGLHNGGASVKSNNPNTVTLYIDNVTYTRVAGNTIQGNFIGTTSDGMDRLGNVFSGVRIVDSTANRIGGMEPGARNIISGNGHDGIRLLRSDENSISGNLIGLDAAGSSKLGNALDGIELEDSSNNTIGGTTELERNVISGNGSDGIQIKRGSANVLQGNYIGTDADGTIAVANRILGIWLINSADNLIGGGDTDSGNVISGNNNSGIAIYYADSTGNKVQGNYIGTDATGLNPLGNLAGIDINFTASANVIGTDGDGVNDATEGNVIAGHIPGGTVPWGVWIGVGSNDNVVAGNLIGTDATGTVAINTVVGMQVFGDNNIIGTNGDGISDAMERNVISGNDVGAQLHGSHNVFAGNFVGTAADGLTQLGNTHGVIVHGDAIGFAPQDNVIGGTTETERNVISGNFLNNVFLARSLGTKVQGNYIGTDWSGTVQVANDPRGVVGIHLEDDKNSLIGGTELGASNLISGQAFGIRLDGRWVSRGTENTRIQGNRIGTTADGQLALRNWTAGVYLAGHVDSDGVTHEIHDVTIGGTAPGAGNLISGNLNQGIRIIGPGVQNLRIQGNKIGTDIDGAEALPNGTGVLMQNASDVLIGGTEAGTHNVITGNTGSGVSISGGFGNTIQGNYIGVGPDGHTDLGNFTGVKLLGGSDNRVGGTLPGEGNVISGNFDGIIMQATVGTTVQGNLIGTDATGTFVVPNFLNGIFVVDDSDSLIGGTDPAAGNLISGNSISIRIGASSMFATQGLSILGNRIGTNVDGTGPLGNSFGIHVQAADTATISDVMIGGIDPGAGNVIAYSTHEGVAILANGARGVTARGNSIHSNGALGIDLGPAGVTPNDDGDIDAGPNGLQNFPEITSATAGQETSISGQLDSAPNTTFIVDFYANASADPSGFGEGETWLGFTEVTTNNSGIARLSFSAPVDLAGEGMFLTATATDPLGNTSEFSEILMVRGNPQPDLTPRLVISEIMQNPSGADDFAGEWFEVYNPTNRPIDINGWLISDDGTDSHVIDSRSPVHVPAGGYLVLGNNGNRATNGGVPVDYVYQGISLSNFSDALRLTDPADFIVDYVAWDNGVTFPDPSGASMALRDPSLDNHLGSSWCTSSTPYGDGDLGTPGEINVFVCAEPVLQLMISEIMQDPAAVSDRNGEWFELFNPTDSDININGWTIGDGRSENHLINNGGPLIVSAGGYLVLGNNGNPATNGGVPVDYVYQGISLSNAFDTLQLLEQTGAVVDEVAWDNGATFPDPNGASMALKDPALDNTWGTNWCESSTQYGNGDLGTPGTINFHACQLATAEFADDFASVDSGVLPLAATTVSTSTANTSTARNSPVALLRPAVQVIGPVVLESGEGVDQSSDVPDGTVTDELLDIVFADVDELLSVELM